MYRYDQFDDRVVRTRVAEFRDQVERRLSGALSDEEFRPLRLMNGLYLQLHAYMLRVAIPYGTLSSTQLRALAEIADRYDRGYGHFTTRTNLQFNWPRLADVPDILERLAEVGMHAIQTSGNCIRNVTTDAFAGVAPDEIEDPRPVAELIRQWACLQPEFAFLPRKFKIAVAGGPVDRAATKVHDVGLRTVRRATTGEIGYEVTVGGGLGRTPVIGKVLRDFVAKRDLLAYLEAILTVYNLEGRRDNKYKARIKILVAEGGLERFADRVEAVFAARGPGGDAELADLARIAGHFVAPRHAVPADAEAKLAAAIAADRDFARWVASNTHPHKVAGHVAVTISLKTPGSPPGDATAEQMRLVADLAEAHSFSEIRVTLDQNLVLADVRKDELHALWRRLVPAGLASANAGLVTDIVSCPGLDYCGLATARSIPLAQAIALRFADPDRQHDIGPIRIKISGCINACSHHHVAHIGVLGLEKRDAEAYQITLGGDGGDRAAIGEAVGPAVSADEVPEVIDGLIGVHLDRRLPGESFIETVRRIGTGPFKAALSARRAEVNHAVA
jgi:sulfite reductase (NADPH) hemoprotein beta-component